MWRFQHVENGRFNSSFEIPLSDYFQNAQWSLFSGKTVFQMEAEEFEETQNADEPVYDIDFVIEQVKPDEKKKRTYRHRKKYLNRKSPRFVVPILCRGCLKKFKQSSSRRRHEQNCKLYNAAGKRFYCSSCNRSYSRQDSLTKHIKRGRCG